MFYEFGPFRVNVRDRVLLRDGREVALTPKVFDILLALIENSGRILTKDELMRRVWPETIVEETNVTRNVSTLRKALGDSSDQRPLIETIPWRGYRFTGAVWKSGGDGPAIDSLAVLPFLSEGGAEDSEYLAEGITESLIRKLSLLTDLRVMSRHSVFNCKTSDPLAAGRLLNVRAVLTGRMRRIRDTLIVSVELVDAHDDRHLWGAQYNRELSDVFDLQETISQQIAEQLRVRLATNEKQRLGRRDTESAEAHALYLKGRFFWNKLTPDGVGKSIEFFRQAIDKDAGYALAYIGLHDSYTYLNSPAEARKAASKALDLNPMLGEAHASLGFFKFLYDWDFEHAESQFSQAIELSPNYAQAHHWYAIYLANMGRHQEAIREARLAQQLDPLSLLMNHTIGLVLYLARDYDGAIAEMRKVIEMDAAYVAARSTLGLAYAQKGLSEEAIAEFRKIAEATAGHPAVEASVNGMIAYAAARAGHSDRARKLVAEISNGPAAPSYFLAMIFGQLGEKDRAFEWLERAFQERNVQLVCARSDPALDPLRSDARFQGLLSRLGLQSES